MPRHPGLSGPSRALPGSTFDRLLPRLGSGHEIAPLHIGDTCLPPPLASRLGALGFTTGAQPELYRYSRAAGEGALIEAIVRKVDGLNQLGWCRPEHVQVAAGATHALAMALRAIGDAGDEILLLAPHWPLIRGVAVATDLRPVEVPFSQALYGRPDLDVAALIEAHVTPRTVALYFATPNNPDGKVLGKGVLEAIAAVARRHRLWVVADEVYEHYLYEGREHVSIASLPGMAERTCTAFSFSKSFGQAGLRVGYLVAPADVIATCRGLMTHSVFCVPLAMQRAALAALEGGGEFVTEARAHYRTARDLAAAEVRAGHQLPEGATYLFLDLRPFVRAGETSTLGVLERLADVGVMLAPGELFGAAGAGFARLCFTAVALDPLARAIERLNRVLGG